MGLVDNHDVVVGDHRHPLHRVDRQQRVVGDDQVRALRLLPGPLGEALLGERALGGPQALPVVDADLSPDPVGVPRRVVPLAGAVPRGLLLRPGPKLEHLRALRTGRHLDQHPLVVGHALTDPVQAGVVGAALEDGVRRVDAGQLAHRLHQPRDVPLDQLVLERQRRGGDHHALVVQQRRDQVAEGLAGAGAGLDEQVLPAGERRGDRVGHRDLAVALLTSERGDRGRQHVAHRGGGGWAGGLGHPGTLVSGTDQEAPRPGAVHRPVRTCGSRPPRRRPRPRRARRR